MAEKDGSVPVAYSDVEQEGAFPVTVITPEVAAQSVKAEDTEADYRIGIDDVLRVIVWNHPELTGNAETGGLERTVRGDGSIYFPLIGNLQVAGNTESQVRKVLISRLAVYLENFHADVVVAKHRSKPIYVLGEVQRQATHYMTRDKITLAEALSLSGGVNPITSNPEHIYVVRGKSPDAKIFRLNGKSPVAVRLADEFRLQPRDVVYVGTAGVTRWHRVFSQIASSTSAVNDIRFATGN